jgi:hypothetical protein
MPKRNQQHPARAARGRNNPTKSTVITTGTPKKQETYQKEAAEHINPAKTAQVSEVPPVRDKSMGLTHQADSRARAEDREHRSGSASNARKHRKEPEVHSAQKKQSQSKSPQFTDNDYIHELKATHRRKELE